ncbi:amidase [Isoptericola sp. AK164]|uniref:amidase n=1 Tax=Isoptericola sp. AK164 TaxID=3024246 RepID=UPI0024188063|nr:amidase [Isoptericola sp. AK164]
MNQQSRRRHRVRRKASGVAVTTATLAAFCLAPASAYNPVPVVTGDAWNVHDAASPGVDTGSVMDTESRALMGYGGLRIQVEGGTSPLGGILLRGFELTYDEQDTFSTTQGVDVDGVVVQRELRVDQAASYGRFLDSFTNTTDVPVTVETAFGGQLGYDTGTNQSAIAGTSDGDTTISDADGWASWYTPSDGPGSASRNGPSATAFGSPGFEPALERMGNFLRDPFTNDLPTEGDEANHPAFVNSLTIDPGETVSLAHFVVTGLSETSAVVDGAAVPEPGSQVDLVEAKAAALSTDPDLAGLTPAEVCSLANFDLVALGVTDCSTPSGEVQGGIDQVAAPVTLTTSTSYDVVGKTITDLISDMESGETTAAEITQAYLDRIAAYDRGPFGLHSVIAVAPTAIEQAEEADAARADGSELPLLGVPILVKDIIDTKDMPTTGGSLVFDGYQPTEDAWQVKKLREAGAIILGKANLAEFANDGHYSPSAYGQVWNAYDPSRSPIGSSGGTSVAVASSFAAAGFGTQTGDSLWGPAGAASLFSLRGTDGMQSSAGTMPLTIIQDYVGFISQSTEDLALLLEATAVDNPDDVLDDVANGHRPDDWTEYFSPDVLDGKVIGVPEGAFDDPFGTTVVSDALRAQFSVFEDLGATVIEIPEGPDAGPREFGGDTNYEGWAQWIEAHPDNPYTSPEEITRSPLRIPTRINTSEYTGAGRMTDEDQRAFEQWRADWRADLGDWMDDHGVDAVLYAAELSDIHLNDSIIPSFGRINPESSYAGVPTAIFPAGVNAHGNPIGFQLQGKEFQDAELLGMAYAFDQATDGRVLPEITPALAHDADAPAQVVEPLPALPQAVAERPAFVLDTTATVATKAKGRAPAKVTFAVDCTGAGACSGRLEAAYDGETFGARSLRVTDSGTSVSFSLPDAAAAAWTAGETVTFDVTLSGKKATVAPTDAVEVVAAP